MTNSDYFGSHDLMTDSGEYGQITVTIQSVSQDKVKGADGKDSLCIVAKTAETKPIILNKTNCKTISKLYGPYTENWAGEEASFSDAGPGKKLKPYQPYTKSGIVPSILRCSITLGLLNHSPSPI